MRFYEVPGRLLVTLYMVDMNRFHTPYVFMPKADFLLEPDGLKSQRLEQFEAVADEMKR